MANPVTDPKILARLRGGEVVDDQTTLSRLADAPVDFSFIEMAKNIPSSGKQYLRDIYTAISNPVDTATNLGKAVLGAAQLAVPGEQGYEDYARTVGNMYKDRYGSWDQVKTTIQNDPVGFLSDASLPLVAVGALPGISGKVSKIGAAMEPLQVAANMSKAAVGAIPGSQKMANSMYRSAAKFNTTDPFIENQRAANTALKNQIMPTGEGLLKLDGLISETGKVLDGLIDQADNTNIKIPASKVLDAIDQVKNDVGSGFKFYGKRDTKIVDRLKEQFEDFLFEQNITEVTPSQLQKFKQDLYKEGIFDYEVKKGSRAKQQTERAMSRAAKEELEKLDPRIKGVNQKLGGLLELKEKLPQKANRIENRDPLPFYSPTNVAAGALGGGVPLAIAGAGLSIGMMPKNMARGALALSRWNEKGLRGLLDVNPTISYGGKGLLQMGRLDDYLTEILGQ